MRHLRKECPRDKKQTPQSLRQYILEEAHEVVEAIDKKNNNCVIKALAMPPGLNFWEYDSTKAKFAKERDLTDGLNKILHGKGIAKVIGYGIKYTAKCEEFHSDIREGILPLSIPYFVTSYVGGGDLEKVVDHSFPLKV